MDEALRVVVEMTEAVAEGLGKDLQDITDDEAHWRPLPEANSIAIIVRHLAIEAGWHHACLERGEVMPHETSPELQRQIDAVPLDLTRNRGDFEAAFAGFLSRLRNTTLEGLAQATRAAYGPWPSCPEHFLGFHQAMHVSMHWGQIRTIRNLYEKTRVRPARFFPENPTCPSPDAGVPARTR